MGLFVLQETAAGFALFKAKDKKILKKDDFSAEVETAEGVNGLWVRSLSNSLIRNEQLTWDFAQIKIEAFREVW